MKRELQIFGNKLTPFQAWLAESMYRRYRRKYPFDEPPYRLTAHNSHPAAALLGVQNLAADDQGQEIRTSDGVILGTIRMGFGHYRMSLALASAAVSMGLTPYWLDFLGFPGSAATGIIHELEKLYSFGSRVSQVSELFNTLIWEPITSEAGRSLLGNMRDRRMTSLFAPLCAGLPKDMPFVAAHPWTAQAAIAAGMTNVVAAIPDNLPLGFHLAEGAVHCVQTPSAFMGYRMLKNMGKHRGPGVLPADQIRYTGHYVDHELVSNIETDCAKRFKRLRQKLPKRFLLTIGGAGAQVALFMRIISLLAPLLRENRVAVWVNLGDHQRRYNEFTRLLSNLSLEWTLHSTWDDANNYAQEAYEGTASGLHLFLFNDTFPAVYATNVLMRAADVLVTKPSELSFYPVPKIFIRRVGMHEAWGATRGAEIGDGTLELQRSSEVEQVLHIMMEDDDLLHLYNTNIIKNKEIGLYDGAYNVMKAALELRNRKK